MQSNLRRLYPIVSGTGTGVSTEEFALNVGDVVSFGVEWPALITAGAYTLEFIPSVGYAGAGQTAIGPIVAPSAAQFDCEAVTVAAMRCRVRRTVALTGTGTPTLHLFIRQ